MYLKYAEQCWYLFRPTYSPHFNAGFVACSSGLPMMEGCSRKTPTSPVEGHFGLPALAPSPPLLLRAGCIGWKVLPLSHARSHMNEATGATMHSPHLPGQPAQKSCIDIGRPVVGWDGRYSGIPVDAHCCRCPIVALSRFPPNLSCATPISP